MREPDKITDRHAYFGRVIVGLNYANGSFTLPMHDLTTYAARRVRDDLAAALAWYERRKDAAE